MKELKWEIKGEKNKISIQSYITLLAQIHDDSVICTERSDRNMRTQVKNHKPKKKSRINKKNIYHGATQSTDFRIIC